MSQATLNLGFEEILCTSELDVVLLSSSASHMSKELPDMVKRDLFEFFCDREKICNLNKAKNYALGRWVSRYILNKHFGERENVLRRIVNPMGTVDAMEFVLSKMKETKTNADFFEIMNPSRQ